MRGGVVGLGLLLLVGGARGQGVAYASRQLVEEAEELAEWCTKKKLLRSRNEVFELILLFEPDHEKARHWLRYERQGDAWVRPKPYKAPRDFDNDAIGEFRTRRAALASRFVERLWPAVEQGGPAARHETLAAILLVDPGNERAREANGEVLRNGRWVLRETATALQRRPELQRLAGRALAAVPAPAADELTDTERSLGLRWTGALRGHWWRFVSTSPAEEVRPALRAADAAAEFFAGALPDEARPVTPEGMRACGAELYFLQGDEEGARFLRTHPAITPADRGFAERLSGTWVPGSYARVQWFSTPEGRRDGASRAGIDTVMGFRYGNHKQGWIVEGFGLYLNAYLVGTRLTTYVSRTDYATDRDRLKKLDLWRRMKQRGSDWLLFAHHLREESGKPVDLRFLAAKGLNEMNVEDLVHAHSLAAYLVDLVEGRPDGVSRFLALSIDRNLDDALAEAYGVAVGEVDARLARWLRETR
jgi:hypothetical protein